MKHTGTIEIDKPEKREGSKFVKEYPSRFKIAKIYGGIVIAHKDFPVEFIKENKDD